MQHFDSDECMNRFSGHMRLSKTLRNCFRQTKMVLDIFGHNQELERCLQIGQCVQCQLVERCDDILVKLNSTHFLFNVCQIFGHC